MKQRCAFFLIVVLLCSSVAQLTSAQTSSEFRNPYVREVNETKYLEDSASYTESELEELELMSNLATLDNEGDKLQTAFGIDEDGALNRLKIKPSDKKRLIKLANGSMSESEKQKALYDKDLMRLLVGLVTPKELGGEGFEHIRVGDLLRLRNDPRSRETEQSDNISQHQFGKAADIVEINKTHCTKKSFFGSEDMPAFPVKVIWQGGAPYNPSLSSLGAFDAVARANAFRDILGSLPAESYNGSIQGLEELLQQLQRRVIADSLNLDRASLDTLINNDVLETLGRTALSQQLGYGPGGFLGNSSDELLRSLSRAAIEEALVLPPGSLAGDSVQDSLERLGRYKVALDNDIPVERVLAGDRNALSSLSYYEGYARTAEAFRLPNNVLTGIQSNNARSFAQVGAITLADRLRYSPEEQDKLVQQAGSGSVTQITLGRYGDIPTLQGSPLLILAPDKESSKAAGERYIARQMLKAESTTTLDAVSSPVQTLITERLNLRNTATRQETAEGLFKAKDPSKLFRHIGAAYMEEMFDLPELTLSEIMRSNDTPTLGQFQARLGRQLLLEEKRRVTDDQAKKRGDDYLRTTFIDTFRDYYPIAQTGIATFTLNDAYQLILGSDTRLATRAGASWVEEDLSLAPGSFDVFFVDASTEERLVNAGVTVLAAELFDTFDVNAASIQSGSELKVRLGQAKVETILGLTPGTFRDSLDVVKRENGDRFATIFASPSRVDIMLGLAGGTTQRFLNGQEKPTTLAQMLGERFTENLRTENLQNKLGWDNRFLIDGEKLLRTIESPNATTTDKGSRETVSMRSLLAQIGAYNADFAFGYDPGTMQAWMGAESLFDRNQVLLEEGGELYATRSGFSFDDDDDLLDVYRTNDAALRNRVMRTIEATLEKPLDQAAKKTFQFQGALLAELEKGLDTLEKARSAISYARDRQAIEDLLDKVRKDADGEHAKDYYAEAKSLFKDIAGHYNLPTSSDQLITQTLATIDSRLGSELAKLDLTATGGAITIPAEDLATFVNGDIWTAMTVIVAATQAKSVTVDFGVDRYLLFRLMSGGWSTDKAFEADMSQRGIAFYAEVLQDAGILKDATLVDQVLGYITEGKLTAKGEFHTNGSPYSGSLKEEVKAAFFSLKKARNTYFYGLLDSEIRKKDASIPPNFSEILMEGSNKQRSYLIYDYLRGKLDTGILRSLPQELQPVVRSFLNSYDPESGKFLMGKPEFREWATEIVLEFSGVDLPPEAIEASVRYVIGLINSGEGINSSSLRAGISALASSHMTLWVGKALGLPVQQMQTYYAKYQQARQLYQAYKAGSLDSAQAVLVADQLLFDGKLTEFTYAIDDALGLPAGSSVLLIQFAITGNPLHLVQFVFNLFFTSTIECPDLQQEAQDNVRQLIRGIINLSSADASLIPSQIITFHKSYLEDLANTIQRNYFVCPAGSRCGVFARPEYAAQVHIGF